MAALLLSGPGAAEDSSSDWMSGFTRPDGVKIFLSLDLKVRGNIATLWVKSDASGVRKFSYAKLLALWNIDCAERKLLVTSTVAYRKDGSVLQRKDVPDDPGLYQPIVPDSEADAISVWICANGKPVASEAQTRAEGN
jgi:hypothetical protein